VREAVRGRLPAAGAWALLGVLLALVAVNLPELGSDPWPFRPPSVHPEGPLAPLVRAAGREWDTGIARAAAFLAALLVALAGAFTMRRRSWPAWWGSALVLLVSLALLLPSTLLQAGLRQSTAPWFYVNDSTYQVELAGDLLRHGHNPYGHDYRSSGMERFYTYDGTVSPRVRRREVALRHYAYLPGTVVTAAVWGLLPKPLDDYRLFILLATVGCFFAVMAFRAPLSWRLAIGAIVVCNPIAVRSAWFGQNDAPSLLFLILAVMLLKRSLPRAELKRVAVVFVAVLAAGILPFLLWDPRAFIDDTVRYGAGTYRIVGYGLSAILVRLGVVADREGSYPFALLAVLLWLPLTAWLLYAQWHARELWLGAAAFAISILVLLFIGRTFNNYYLVWPLMGAAIAAAMAGGERAPARAPPPRGA
jgi:hypothetical protein